MKWESKSFFLCYHNSKLCTSKTLTRRCYTRSIKCISEIIPYIIIHLSIAGLSYTIFLTQHRLQAAFTLLLSVLTLFERSYDILFQKFDWNRIFNRTYSVHLPNRNVGNLVCHLHDSEKAGKMTD